MTVLASGSKGNSTIIASRATRVLVDAGLSCRELLRRMAHAGEDASALDAILVTHEHQDHVLGLAALARRLRIPVFFTEATHRAWIRMLTPKTTMTYAAWLDQLARERQAKAQAALSRDLPSYASPVQEAGVAANHPAASTAGEQLVRAASIAAAAEGCPVVGGEVQPGRCSETQVVSEDEACDAGSGQSTGKADPTYLPKVEYFKAGTSFSIGDLDIVPFTIPHDAADPCGFVVGSRAETIRMAVATDLGYIPPNVKAALRNVDVLLIESNHDLEMLREGPYPWSVKQRVLSRVGHLSNDAAAAFLERDYDGGAAYIVLGHLSESNNAPELARLAAERAVGDRLALLGNRIVLAQQNLALDPITL